MSTPNTNPFQYHRDEAERAHAALFRAHHDMVKARNNIAIALREMQGMEESRDNRAAAEIWIPKIKTLRNSLEDTLSAAGRVCTDLIVVTGCDGTCHK